ncbi:isochorismatase family protein [Marinivivus vitaminiproducens]|uniref:isochorismatase family protein n=1 Tax=Marinivivus vitaminiproducens TaxID=3035935 RepID=UPI0027AAD58D|nr:isochorismatase family protein [Geminicoccaceae bacterium SCSIO 64248]
MLIRAQDCLLLVIDIQTQLAKVMPALDPCLERILLLLEAAKTCDVPVMATEQYPKGLGPTLPAVAAYIDPADVTAKLAFGAVGEPGFVEALERHGRDTVVVIGMEAHVCVLQTALGLAGLGRHVVVVADAVQSRKEQSKALALERMRRAGVTVANAEMVVFEWLGRAGTPAFKHMIGRIK